jgi:hypothetical protein
VPDEDYVVENTPDGPTLIVTGPWTSRIDRLLEAGEADGLTLNYARGFAERDLSFLQSWPLRRLDILDRSLVDLGPIERVAGSLEVLSVQASPEARVDLGRMPNLRAVAGEWSLLRPTLDQLDDLRVLTTWKFDEPNLLPLIDQSGLEDLTIKDAPQLDSLEGIGALRRLSTLGIHLARQLNDIADVTDVVPSLTQLRFEYCVRVDALDGLSGASNLLHLGVNECKTIASIRPLRNMSKLKAFHAWGSTVVGDGDLAALLHLPRLREVRMKSRTEYHPSVEEVKATLSST